MLYDLKELTKKYNLNINHVLHIGAHYGDELEVYRELSVDRVLMFEPVPSTFEVLKARVQTLYSIPRTIKFPKEILLANIALGNSTDEVLMYIENNNKSMSSSLLKPKLHLEQYGWIKFNDSDQITVKQCKLDDFLLQITDAEKFDFLNIDVQGYELEVFKGATQSLKNINAIYTEVNRAELYENCCMVEELDEFLNEQGFTRVTTVWTGETWGDALYTRENNNDGI